MNDKVAKAHELFKKGKFKQCIAIVEKINKNKNKQTFTTLEMHAASLATLNLNARARELFIRAALVAPSDVTRAKIYYDIFALCMLLKDYNEAAEFIQLAIALVPNSKSVQWRMALANLYFQLRRYDECEELSAKLLVYKPCTVKCMHMLMDMAVQRSNIDKVDFYLRQFEGRMQELTGKDILGVYARAEAYTTLDFSKSIDKAIARGANIYTVKVIQASSLFKAGKIDECFELLNSFKSAQLNEDPPKKRYNELMGKIYDKRKEYDNAFSYFKALNAIASKQYAERGGASNELSKYGEFRTINFSKKSYKAPIRNYFLVGFPRSGTTLLENVIDTQDRVLALPERPMLDDIKMKLILEGHKYPECLQTISDDYLDELRDYYFKSAIKNSSYESLEEFDVLVDKNPVNSIRMPFIKKLFPDAKIILALRHPLDCILSCYMQNFGVSPHLADFSDWRQCFQRYKDTFDIYEGFKTYMQWDEHQVKYENLVTNFEDEIEGVLKFLDIKADKESYMNFNKRAQSQVITTPSGPQVRQGIYNTSSQRWEKYREYIKPHIELVRPHIERLGYSADI